MKLVILMERRVGEEFFGEVIGCGGLFLVLVFCESFGGVRWWLEFVFGWVLGWDEMGAKVFLFGISLVTF